MNNFEIGNTFIQGDRNRGWFVGHFANPGTLLCDTNVEIKWREHQATECFDYKTGSVGKSLVILINGQIRITLKLLGKEVLLNPA